MKLEQLRPNICELPIEEGYALFEAYYHKRSQDIQDAIAKANAKATRKSSSAGSKKKKKDEVKVTADKLATLRAMGLIK